MVVFFQDVILHCIFNCKYEYFVVINNYVNANECCNFVMEMFRKTIK